MSEQADEFPGDPDKSNDGSEVFGQQIKHRQLSARVPESISRGTFSSGAVVLTGGTEFVIDFMVRLSRPYQVAARVIVPHAAMPHLINALRDNIAKHENSFGKIEPLPQPNPNTTRPTIQEVYDDLKLPDEILSGVYANACMIGHTASEFAFDFVTNFFPRSAVSSRIYLSSRQAPQLLKGLEHAAKQLNQRRTTQQDKDHRAKMDGQANPTDPRSNPDDESPSNRGESDLMY